MREPDRKNASFDSNDSGASETPYEDRDLDRDLEARFTRPSLRGIDVHERPTVIP
jgi:hypothetical protein